MNSLAIITPYYNRPKEIIRLKESLENQTDKNFNWYIIDDGSKKECGVNQLIGKSSEIQNIFLYKKSNGGKISTLNYILPKITEEYVFIVDSDDLLTKDSVEIIKKEINVSRHAKISSEAFAFMRGGMDGKTLGNNVWRSISKLSPAIIGEIEKGEIAYIVSKKILAECKIPEIINEKYFPEQYIWNQVFDKTNINWRLDLTIYLGEYLEDGLTKNFNAILKKAPIGYLLFYSDNLKRLSKLSSKIKTALRIVQCVLLILRK